MAFKFREWLIEREATPAEKSGWTTWDAMLKDPRSRGAGEVLPPLKSPQQIQQEIAWLRKTPYFKDRTVYPDKDLADSLQYMSAADLYNINKQATQKHNPKLAAFHARQPHIPAPYTMPTRR
jgi:hypothetical protein